MAVQWHDVFADALADDESISVAAVVRRYVGREPTRAEITAARRSAHSFAAGRGAVVLHVPKDGKRVLVLARPAADVNDNNRLRDVADWRARPPRRGAPRSDQQVLATLTRHVVAAARAARQLDMARISAVNADAFANDLTAALRDLERLRKRLNQRTRSSTAR